MSRRQTDLFPELPDGKKYVSDYPELAAEWHPTKNGETLPEDFLHGSNKKVWWVCEHGHEWSTSPAHRVAGQGCPICYNANRSEKARPIASPIFNLTTENPSVCKQWDYQKNDKPPQFYLPNSGAKVWWICEQGSDHSWKAAIHSRTSENDGFLNSCPFCAGRKPSKAHNLAKSHPELMLEWHPSKNKKLPTEYTPKSNSKVWWICSRGHEWEAQINNRANGRGCPKCSNQSSKNEIRIYTEMLSLFDRVETRKKFEQYEVDVFIEDLSVAIEYDRRYWHQEKHEADNAKQQFVTALGIQLIRVREAPLKAISEGDLIVSPHKEVTKEDIVKILKVMKTSDDKISNYISVAGFTNEALFRTYLDYFPSPFPEHSLAEVNVKLASEWHPERNKPLTPYNFSPNSGQKVWWICDKGHEWEATIDSRNSKSRPSGCPDCSPTRKRVTQQNCMAVTHPHLAEMFHPTKNGAVTPETVVAGTGRRLWWQCPCKPEHEFERSGSYMSRLQKGSHCPYCRKK